MINILKKSAYHLFNLNIATSKIAMLIFTASILGIIAFSEINGAEACKCLPPAGARDRFCMSNFVAIFNITNQTLNCQPTTNCYDFKIRKEFSRPKSSGLKQITTSYSSASCGVDFQVGDCYLIFANVESGSESVRTLSCDSPINWTNLGKKERKQIKKDMQVKKRCNKIIP